MAKIDVLFDGANYSIEELDFVEATDALKAHLSTVMSGSGAVIDFGGISYNVDSTKLSTARNAFVSHLGTISGSGKKVVVNGIEYSVDSAKVANAVSDLRVVLGGISSGGDSGSDDDGDILDNSHPIEWNTMEVLGNTSVFFDEFGYLVRVSNIALSLDDLTGLQCNLSMGNDMLTLYYAAGDVYTEDGITGAMYTDVQGSYMFMVFSVPANANYAQFGLSKPGIYVTNVGHEAVMGIDCNVMLGIPSHIDLRITSAHRGLIGYDASAAAQDLVIPSSFTNEFGTIYNVVGIENGAFLNCTNLTSVVIPDSVTTIDNSAFEGCTNLASVVIPNGVTTIGPHAFRRTNLTSVIIPNSVTTIDSFAFYNCTNLTNINIGTGVTFIGEKAFYVDSYLETNFEFNGNTYVENYNWAAHCRDYVISDIFINAYNLYLLGYEKNYVPSELIIPEYIITCDASGAKRYNIVGVTDFENQTNLTKVVIPEGAHTIYNNTFKGCTNLVSVTIPDSVTIIKGSAFADCSNLTNVTMNGVTTIESYAFYGCSNLTRAIMHGVTYIGNNAFYGCSSLVSVFTSDGITYIGEYAFENCTSLTAAIIGSGVTTIERYTFCGCTNLVSVTIPNSVTLVKDYAFDNCTSLTDIMFIGTMEELRKLDNASGSYSWRKGIPATKVVCCDGDVSINPY